MTTRNQRTQLISPDDVDSVFDDATIRRLAEVAGLPTTADLNPFGRSIRMAARQYLADAATPKPRERRKTFEALAELVREALDGKPDAPWAAAWMLTLLHPETRRALDEYAYPRKVPAAVELMHPYRGRKALALLYGLLHRGAQWKPGRKRLGGKRSRWTLRGEVVGSRGRVGRPPNTPEFMLCTWLAIAYYIATDKSPPLRVSEAYSSRLDRRHLASPFGRLVSEVLALLGVENVSAVEIIRRYGEARRAAKRPR